MHRLWIGTLIAALTLVFVCPGDADGRRRRRARLSKVSDKRVLKLFKEFSDSKKIALYKTREGRFATFRKDGKKGFLLLTQDYARVRGYNGATSIKLMLDDDGKILKAELFKSTDTKDYVMDIIQAGFFDRYKGKTVQNDLNVDVVTGATESCVAFSKTVGQTLKAFEEVRSKLTWKEDKLTTEDSSLGLKKVL